MTVFEALKEALHSNAKIALPEMGTFVTDYSPAYIHPTQHLFQPPHKKISFAPELKTDDNLLLTYLMEYNKYNVEKARKEIRLWTAEIQQKLSIENKYVLEGIGEWYYDIEKQLQFKADSSINFMKEAYGLPPFVADTVTRKSNIPLKKPTKKNNDAITTNTISLMKISYIILGIVMLSIVILIILIQLHIIKY